jgi:hypothetical protein
MKSEVEIELLVGEEREKRAILDFCSWTVFSLDFVRVHFGEEGPILLGRHWGSLEKLGWRSMREQKLSPSEFLAGTYRYNWEPMGFKATVYEEIENVKASMLVKVNPLADFIREYMAGVSVLTEEDAWKFLCACFEWVRDYGYKFKAEKTSEGYKLTITKK